MSTRAPASLLADGHVAVAEPERVIEARGLTAGYGGTPIVRELDLVVRRGEVVALLGPNGAGKTTTLLALVGELKPMAGSVWWNGSEARSPLNRRARDGLAFLLEGKSVCSRLTAAQNLAISRASVEDGVVDLFPELRAVLSRRGGLLSGGEQRMLGVGRALSSSPRLLLADELSLGLAPMMVQRILRVIREAADAGVSALIVEQHVHRALEVADRLYVMHGGRLQLSIDNVDPATSLEAIRESYLASGSDVT
jgi:branched-chain amino acid transport system ATP-binding protein